MDTLKAIDILKRTDLDGETALRQLQGVYHACVNLGEGKTNLYDKALALRKIYRLNTIAAKARRSQRRQQMDLISRQDAIDALSEDIEDCFVLHDVIKSIQRVPSAEIIRCKDCKHRSKSGLCNMWSVFGTVTTDDDMYCSYGERGDSDDE